MQQRCFIPNNGSNGFPLLRGLAAAGGAIGGIAFFLALKYITDNYKFEVTRKNMDKSDKITEHSNDNQSTMRPGK